MEQDTSPGPITDDVRAIIEVAHLCFAATVSPGGLPNLSPKGTIRAWDSRHVYFLDIASPGTRANLGTNSAIELNVVDQLSRRGFRIAGTAEVLTSGEVHDACIARVLEQEGSRYDVASVIFVTVTQVSELRSPGYLHAPSETAMRAAWRERRHELDRHFDHYLQAREHE